MPNGGLAVAALLAQKLDVCGLVDDHVTVSGKGGANGGAKAATVIGRPHHHRSDHHPRDRPHIRLTNTHRAVSSDTTPISARHPQTRVRQPAVIPHTTKAENSKTEEIIQTRMPEPAKATPNYSPVHPGLRRRG